MVVIIDAELKAVLEGVDVAMELVVSNVYGFLRVLELVVSNLYCCWACTSDVLEMLASKWMCSMLSGGPSLPCTLLVALAMI